MNRIEKSFDIVQDTSKLLVSLSTGFIAFTVTFSKELDAFKLETYWETVSWTAFWVCMLLSVAAGIWTLLGLTTTLEPKNPREDYSPTIRSPQIKSPFAIQIISFGVSVFFMVLFGIIKIFPSLFC